MFVYEKNFRKIYLGDFYHEKKINYEFARNFALLTSLIKNVAEIFWRST